MTATLAFDVYGTLIDTHGVLSALSTLVGDKASDFSHTWRDKQLEYSFRRGLMQHYEPFAVCTRHALDYTCLHYRIELDDSQKQQLLTIYKTLPAFDDVMGGLERLKRADYRLFAFSNGTREAVDNLLVTAGIRHYFEGIVSVDDIKSFKPSPAVYSHLLRQTNTKTNNTWLISSNPFDIIGALSAGLHSAWVKRSEDAIFDPWGVDPTITIQNINDLLSAMETYSR